MADWDSSAEEYQALFDEWVKKYSIVRYYEACDEYNETVSALDGKLVWSLYTTSEDAKIANGYQEFTGNQSSNWNLEGWFEGTVKWDGEEDSIFINESAYLPCRICNPDGEGEGDPDCENGQPDSECVDGFINYHFDSSEIEDKF